MTDRRSDPETYAHWLAALPAAVCVTDAELDGPGPQIRYVNAAFAALLGFPAAELVGARAAMLRGDSGLDPEMRARLLAGETWRGRMVNRCRDGSTVRVTWTVSPVHDRAGCVTGYAAVQTDPAGEPERDACAETFENAPFGIYTTTPEGRFVRVNPAMARLYGCADRAEFLATFANTEAAFADPGRPDLPAYLDKASRDAFVDEMTRTGRVAGLEVRARRKDGSVFWSQEDARAIHDARGDLVGYEGFIQDITARKTSEVQLAEANRRLRQIAEIAGIGGWEYEPETGALSWDPEIRRIVEVPPDYTPSYARALSFYPPAAQAQLSAAVERALADGESFDLELPVVTASGREIWARLMGQPATGRDGRVNRLTGVFQDITGHKEAERQLRENAALLEMAGRVARFGGWAADLETGYVHWSDVVADIHEMPRGATPPIEVSHAFIAESDRARIRAAYEACARWGTPYDAEARLVTATGRTLWVRLAGEAVRDEHGRVVRVQGALQDISERKAVETELRLARDQARAADASKTQFLANISHELRTPLNAILGFSDLIRREPATADPDRQAEYAGYIHESGSHLLELVNDLLDMARIDQGAYTLRAEPVALGEIVTASLKLVRQMAQEKGIAVNPDMPEDLPVVYGDARALRQVVLNLLTNAIKFTPEGGRVDLRAREVDGYLRLDVADTGVGIPQADLERVLRPFERGERHLSHDRQGGTGLGLGISRSFVEMHGGELTLDSAPNAGTTATIHLPPDRLMR